MAKICGLFILFLCFRPVHSHSNVNRSPWMPVTKDKRLIRRAARQSWKLLGWQWIDSSRIGGLRDVNFVLERRTSPSKVHVLKFYLILWQCARVCSRCVCVCVQVCFYCMCVFVCVKANAWPFSQRINRSSVAAVTGEIRDWLCPCVSHHPSSSAMSVHAHACVCACVDT